MSETRRKHDATQDDAKTVEWFRAAAEQGDADAQYNLGVMYANGEGVARDAAKAMEWYHASAEQGHANAQFALGVMYAKGDGVAQDYAESVEWHRTRGRLACGGERVKK